MRKMARIIRSASFKTPRKARKNATQGQMSMQSDEIRAVSALKVRDGMAVMARTSYRSERPRHLTAPPRLGCRSFVAK
jgi:hypothetical protein